MEQVFSIGHDIWSFFQTLLSPDQYLDWAQSSWPLIMGIFAVSALVFALKSRGKRMERRRQLEALEEALLDEDIEDKSLELPESALDADLFAEYSEGGDLQESITDDYEAETPQGTLARDPEFGGQIVLDANSSRKALEESDVKPPAKETPSADSMHSVSEIDEEFAQFAQELKEKAKEVQHRHQIEDELMENELFEKDFSEDPTLEEAPAPVLLSAVDILPDEPDDSKSDWNQELEDLLEEPEYSGEPDDAKQSDDLYQQETVPDRAPLEIQERNELLIRNLEEFQKDFEHKLQSRTLSRLTQKNFELVESLSDSTQARDYQEMKREQMQSLSSLESMVYGLEKKKR